MSEAVAEVEVRSQIIPLDGMYLVLPNTAIAEVISYADPDKVDNAPDWLLGTIIWRGTTVPLIGFETASAEKAVQPGKRSRIIILNAIGGEDSLPFYGILAQGIPRLINLNESNIHNAEDIQGQPKNFVTSHTVIDSTQAMIPDQSALEAAIKNAI